MALFFAGCTSAPPTHPKIERLKHQIVLAEEGKAYIQVVPGALEVFIKGVKVKRIPVRRVLGREPGSALARVAWRRAAIALQQITVEAEEIADEPDTVGSVASPDEIVSVHDMPETYLVRMTDGTLWFVSSGDWQGVRHTLATQWLRYRTAFYWLGNVLWHGSGKLTILQTDPRAARELYWLMREDMGVIL